MEARVETKKRRVDDRDSEEEEDSSEKWEASTSASWFAKIEAQFAEIKWQMEANHRETKETLQSMQDQLGEFIYYQLDVHEYMWRR